MGNTLLTNLQNSALFPHPVTEFTTFETHSSLVLATGDYVYKIKKPVNFGFLDYSSLEKRKYYCQREIDLNHKLASNVYINVVALYGDETHPSFVKQGEPFEYAVKMRQFPQENIFSALLTANKITPDIIEQLAQAIATFHQDIPIADDSVNYGDAQHIHQFAMDNFSETLPMLKNTQEINRLKKLESITQACYDNISAALQQRKDNGFVRQCHGDMHLNNIVLLDQQPVIFDCIEFNEDFIWTDVMGDLGFIIMDLDEHNKSELAHLLLNRYCELIGDYSALKILPYFCAYRAMVRAKVDQIRLTQPGISDTEQQQIWQHYHTCLNMVENYLQAKQPRLMITHGFCASGKSTIARKLVAQLGAIQLRSDVERKRLANIALTADSQSALYDGLYTTEMTNTVYQHLAQLATDIIATGYTVIIDAAFIRHDLRQQFIDLAHTLQVPFNIIACTAPEATLRQWITERQQRDDEISEGHIDILEHQLANHDVLTADELTYTTTINTAQKFNLDQLL